jgi:uncharacterized protein YbjT (DUF2867 family)
MSRIAIVGAHGKVAQQLMRVLYDRGDDFVGLVRSEEHADDVYRLGGEGHVLDIEQADSAAIAMAFVGCDAVVFSAGAGPGSGVARKRTVDYAGSVKSAEAAASAGVRRFVQVSAWGVDAPVAADADLRASGLDWTILRPGGLTFDEGTGHVLLGESVPRGVIPREDVARLIAECIADPSTIGRTWEVVSGDVPIEQAVRALTAAP